MCELLGLCFNQPVDAKFSFRRFRRRGKSNPDGWGFGFYPDKSAQIFKEWNSAHESPLAEFLLNYGYARSRIFISHVRLSSVGNSSHMNTHPFSRELDGKDWVFAHNGTVDVSDLATKGFRPIGETDSERLFCFVLNEISKRNIDKWSDDDFVWLNDLLNKCNRKGSMNCLFSDGEFLFCYRDSRGYNGLKLVERRSPFKNAILKDEDLEVELGIVKEDKQKGFVIATQELTDEAWFDIRPAHLVVFRNGKKVFSKDVLN